MTRPLEESAAELNEWLEAHDNSPAPNALLEQLRTDGAQYGHAHDALVKILAAVMWPEQSADLESHLSNYLEVYRQVSGRAASRVAERGYTSGCSELRSTPPRTFRLWMIALRNARC